MDTVPDEGDLYQRSTTIKLDRERSPALMKTNVSSLDDPPIFKSSPWSRLYGDALLLIYEALLPPSPLLHDSSHPYPTSTWREDLRMRKMLTRVCTRWREAALPLLYSEVTLGHVSQIFAFAQSMHSTVSSVAHLVRTVHFVCPYVPDMLRPLLSKAAIKILRHCGNITGLRFGSEFLNHYLQATTFDLSADDRLFVATLSDIAPRITLLRSEEQGVRFPSFPGGITHLLGFLSMFTGLQSLSLPFNNTSEALQSSTCIHFDQLEHLTLWLTQAQIESDIAALIKWDMPYLKRVDIRPTYMHTLHDSPGSFLEDLVEFFESFGGRIKELNVVYYNDQSFPAEDRLREIVDLCPFLEYLSCPACPYHSFLQSLSSRSPPVQLDMWGAARDIRFVPGSAIPYPNIRIIDSVLMSRPDLPRFLSRPSRVEMTYPAPVIHHVYHVHIVQTSFAVFQLGSARWAKKQLSKALRVCKRPVKMQKVISALQEFYSDERTDYTLNVETDSNSNSSEGSEYEPSDDEDEEAHYDDPDVVEEPPFHDAAQDERYPWSNKHLVWSSEEDEPVNDEQEILDALYHI